MRPSEVPGYHRVTIKYYSGGKAISDSASQQDSTNDTMEVHAHVPEDDIGIAFGGRWDNALDTILPGVRAIGQTVGGLRRAVGALRAGGGSLGIGRAAVGSNTLSQAYSNIAIGDPALSALMYKGSTNPTFSLSLEFHSDGDAYEDVLKPVMTLSKMALPSRRSAGILEIPGPNPYDEYRRLFRSFARDYFGVLGPDDLTNTNADGDARAGEAHISVQIGTLMYFRSVVITNVDIAMGTQVDAAQRPIYARVRVDFTRFTTPLREEVEEMFASGKVGGAP